MKKKIAFGILLCLAMLTATPVFAYNETSYMLGPNAYCGGWSSSGITNISSPSYSSVRGDKTYTYFNYLGTLRTVSVAGNREIFINLMESDVDPNEDDLVKTYVGTIEQRTLTKIKYRDTTTTGNIDSSGDNTVELYISQNMDYLPGDVEFGDNGPLFYYKFRVD